MNYQHIAHTLQHQLASDSIRSMPCDGANFVVTIDGKPYAGFLTKEYAEMAIGIWTGEIDGGGAPIPPSERANRGWRAVRGRRLEIIERVKGSRV